MTVNCLLEEGKYRFWLREEWKGFVWPALTDDQGGEEARCQLQKVEEVEVEAVGVVLLEGKGRMGSLDASVALLFDEQSTKQGSCATCKAGNRSASVDPKKQWSKELQNPSKHHLKVQTSTIKQTKPPCPSSSYPYDADVAEVLAASEAGVAEQLEGGGSEEDQSCEKVDDEVEAGMAVASREVREAGAVLDEDADAEAVVVVSIVWNM
ncbi:hypothetical protein BC829DRAFT_433075 [Chytridium lagenaria]|nr:hypothetical protein BC829DRAFT_433075 [Chytridium lagenaria]